MTVLDLITRLWRRRAAATNAPLDKLTSTGFVASQLRSRIYLVTGALAGAFSLAIGLLFVFELEAGLPSLESIFGFIGPSQ